jgi:hypothetical protein
MFDQPAAHHNPHYDPYPSRTSSVEYAETEKWNITKGLLSRASDFKRVDRMLKSQARDSVFEYVGRGYFYYTHVQSTMERVLQLAGQAMEGSLGFQIGDLFSACNAGDIRFSYEVVDGMGGLSVVGQVRDGWVDVYETSRKYKVGIVRTGQVSVDDMLESKNVVLWINRMVVIAGVVYLLKTRKEKIS